MMKCPMCGRPATVSYQTGRLTCPTCGWGTDWPIPVPKSSKTREVPATNLVAILLLWVFAACVIALAAWLVFGVAKAEPTDKNILIFAVCMVGYGLLGYFVQPIADREGVEWCSDLFDNLFRIGLEGGPEGILLILLSVLLFPGRVMGAAPVHTFYLVRQAVSRGRVPPPSQGPNVA